MILKLKSNKRHTKYFAALAQGFSKCRSWTSSSNISCRLVRNINSQTLDPVNHTVARLANDCDVHSGLRVSALRSVTHSGYRLESDKKQNDHSLGPTCRYFDSILFETAPKY